MSKNFDILMIDDEPLIIDSVKKITALENLTLDQATTAREGLEKMQRNNYKLIFTDIMMPEMDGFQLIEEMRLVKIEIPIVMTTGYSTNENAIRALQEGAMEFIPKPFDIDELLSVIKRGLKFGELQINVKRDDSGSISYVPCPSAFYRLGHTSWLRSDGEGIFAVGSTDSFIKTLTKITEKELLNSNGKVFQGTPYVIFVDEQKLPNQILSPISGTIIQSNDSLKNNLSLIEKDPYFEGWILKIIPTDLENELKNLTPCSSDRL